MTRVFTALLLCLVSVPAAQAQAPSSNIAAADEQAVKDLVAKYHAARDLDDPAAIGEIFTSDADQLVSSGEWRRGRDALIAGMRQSTQAKPGRRTITVETVRQIAPDVVVADARYVIEDDTPGEARRMWSTFVAVRTDQGWRIAALRNMLPAK